MDREIQFDYDNQAWIINGTYQDCAHGLIVDAQTGAKRCQLEHGTMPACYGRLNAGRPAPNIH